MRIEKYLQVYLLVLLLLVAACTGGNEEKTYAGSGDYKQYAQQKSLDIELELYDTEEFSVKKPSDWKAVIVDDSYLQLDDPNSESIALVWPLYLQGEFKSMSTREVANRIMNALIQDFDEFNIENIFESKDRSLVEITATYIDGTPKKGVMILSKQGSSAILSAYESSPENFDSFEPLARAMLASYRPKVSQGSASAPRLSLRQYRVPSVLTWLVPDGWKVAVGGACSTLSVVAWDPDNPLKQVFYLSGVGPLYTDQRFKAQEAYYSPAWGDAPVISPFTAENLLRSMKPISQMSLVQQQLPQFPPIEDVNIISSEPLQLGGMTDTKIIKAEFTQNGKSGRGKFVVSALNYGYPAYGFGMAIGGYSTPPEEFDKLSPVLEKSTRNLNINQNYLASCTQGIRGIEGHSMEDMGYDDYQKGWEQRQEANDRIYDKWSDTIRGRERVYNPDTDEVYSVPNGFYDYYNLNRNKYHYSQMRQLRPEEYKYNPLDGELRIY